MWRIPGVNSRTSSAALNHVHACGPILAGVDFEIHRVSRSWRARFADGLVAAATVIGRVKVGAVKLGFSETFIDLVMYET